MTPGRLILRGLLHHRGAHLGALGTSALAAAVIVASLAVGDSVRSSMTRVAEMRIGRVGFAASARDASWREDLAEELSAARDAPVSAILRLSGTAARPDGSARIARAEILGVDETFWSLSPGGRAPLAVWPRDGLAVSETVATRLRLSVGDALVLRVETPSAMPREAPLASDADATTVLSGTVAAVLDAEAFGRFALTIGRLPPANVFLPRSRLQETVGATGRINALLVDAAVRDGYVVQDAVSGIWRLEDAGLELRRLDGVRGWELRSPRVLLGTAVETAALEVDGAIGVLTWLVNDLAAGERHTPYSLVAAVSPAHPAVPDDLGDDEIVVNEWLARDLESGPDDEVTLRYFVLGRGRRLEERERAFRIRAVVPLTGAAADRDLMPDFPGLTGSENCRDWDPGFALDLERIRDEDEAYWDEHGGTPKAFVSLRTGRAMWGNRFGSLTAVRFPPIRSGEGVEASIRARLDPAAVGLRFTDLPRVAEAARSEGTDLGLLFLGFSAFLVAAALLLLGLVVALNVSMRQPEIATLLALGFTPRRVRRLLTLEHAVVALAGGLVGAALGPALGAAALEALDTVWRDVAGSFPLSLTVRPGTLAAGAVAGAAVAAAVVALVLRVGVRSSVASAFTRREELAARLTRARERRRLAPGIAAALAIFAVVLAVSAGTGRDPATAGAFFGSGALLLVAALVLAWHALVRVGMTRERPTARGLAWRNLGRRRGRSLAVIGLLAFGVFMLLGVTVFRRDRLASPEDRASGTGGFALLGESAMAVVHDLDSPEGRRFHALRDADLDGVRVVGLRVREGDDASCRSLTRAQTPSLLGVDPRALAGRFTFVQTTGEGDDPWTVLDGDPDDGSVLAVIDQATFWTLGVGLDDMVELEDETDRPFEVRIAGVIDNSVFHGHLVVSAAAFERRFPSESGARRFLVDAPAERVDAVAAILTRQLEDRGLALERTEDRLNATNAVENTYLAIFQALGGLGLLLGSLGLALVVGRNAVERRAELALLGAVGFSPRRIERLVATEHAALLGAGLLAGLLASTLSLLPVLVTPGAHVASVSTGLALLALAVGGMLWTLLATRVALRGPLLRHLRDE